MTVFQLPLSYLLWHYSAAWSDLLRLYFNFLWFLYNFFSIKILLGTLFSPWKRLREASSRKTQGGFLGRLILNTITRIVGLLLRLGTIAMGVSALALLSIAFIAWLFLWAVAPLLILALFVSGALGLLKLL